MSMQESGKIIQLYSSFFFHEFRRVGWVAIMALDADQILTVCDRGDDATKIFDRALVKVPIADINISSEFWIVDDNDKKTKYKIKELLYGPRHLGLIMEPVGEREADVRPAPEGSALENILYLEVQTFEEKYFKLSNRFFRPPSMRRTGWRAP